MSKIAIVIYGAPGSGKGTQAELFARKTGVIHFDTGRYMEDLVHDPRHQKDPIIRRERKLFDSGILLTPDWVLKIVKNKVAEIAKKNRGVILSGSPRTLPETEGLLPYLEKIYGKKNIFVFSLVVDPKTSIKRNSHRLTCSFCGNELIFSKVKFSSCPFCGGKLVRRILDKPKTIITRLKEYEKRTTPIFDLFEKRGYKVIKIAAEESPFQVFSKMYGKISNKIR